MKDERIGMAVAVVFQDRVVYAKAEGGPSLVESL
jgi:hypothetical protein